MRRSGSPSDRVGEVEWWRDPARRISPPSTVPLRHSGAARGTVRIASKGRAKAALQSPRTSSRPGRRDAKPPRRASSGRRARPPRSTGHCAPPPPARPPLGHVRRAPRAAGLAGRRSHRRVRSGAPPTTHRRAATRRPPTPPPPDASHHSIPAPATRWRTPPSTAPSRGRRFLHAHARRCTAATARRFAARRSSTIRVPARPSANRRRDPRDRSPARRGRRRCGSTRPCSSCVRTCPVPPRG